MVCISCIVIPVLLLILERISSFFFKWFGWLDTTAKKTSPEAIASSEKSASEPAVAPTGSNAEISTTNAAPRTEVGDDEALLPPPAPEAPPAPAPLTSAA